MVYGIHVCTFLEISHTASRTVGVESDHRFHQRQLNWREEGKISEISEFRHYLVLSLEERVRLRV